jgi:hypothetical protein
MFLLIIDAHYTEIAHISLTLDIIPAIHAKHVPAFMAFVWRTVFYGLEADAAGQALISHRKLCIPFHFYVVFTAYWFVVITHDFNLITIQ